MTMDDLGASNGRAILATHFKPKTGPRKNLRETQDVFARFVEQMGKHVAHINRQLGELRSLLQERTTDRRIAEISVSAVDGKMAEYAKLHADAVRILNALVKAGAVSRKELNNAITGDDAK